MKRQVDTARAARAVGCLILAMSWANGVSLGQAPMWTEDHEYEVDDYARTGAALTTTYKCIQQNESSMDNRPPNDEYWSQVWPQDPPVAADGDGPSGDDWVDFAATASAVLYWDDDGTSEVATALSLKILTDNGNFILANNRNGDGDPVTHVTYKTDYGRVGGPTVEQGNTDWDNYYAGYDPGIVHVEGSNATNTTNCVSYAFNGYVAGAVSSNWTNSGGDADPFTSELTEVAANGNNGNAATQGGDRCYNASHVWTLTGGGAATGQEWKNNSSPLYTWVPDPFTNNSPQGGVGGLVYTQFAIGRDGE